MKNIYEVLRAKEIDLVRLRNEVDALRFVAPLLSDPSAEPHDADRKPQPKLAWAPLPEKNKWPLKVGHAAPDYADS
jgi:hypothetical protein